MTTHTKALLPCPFCGGIDIFIEPDEIGSGGQWVAPIHVGCKACEVEQCEEEEDEAIERWNSRAALATDHIEDVRGMVGWKLVPIEPTDEMQDAFNVACYQTYEQRGPIACGAYKAMLDAAPTPAQQEPTK